MEMLLLQKNWRKCNYC